MIALYYMTTDAVSQEMRDNMLAKLSAKEAEYCRRLKKENDFLLSLCGHYMMCCVTGQTSVSYHKAGKPYYAQGPFVSLSHDGNAVVLAVSDVPCGVDILFADEARKNTVAKVVGRFIHDLDRGLSLSEIDVQVFAFHPMETGTRVIDSPFSVLPAETAGLRDALSFTKAEALMKCDGGGFASIRLLSALNQKMQTLSISIPALAGYVITVAKALSSKKEN